MKDYLEQDVNVNDEIIYPLFKSGVTRYGRMTITMIELDCIRGFSPDGRKTIIRRLSHIILARKASGPKPE